MFTYCSHKKIFLSLRNPNLLTVEMRESMAVSLVASFPKMSQKSLQPEDQPWVNMENIILFFYPLCTFMHSDGILSCLIFCFQTWLFGRRINGGKFARVVARRQNKQKEKRPRGGGTGKKQNA